MAGSLDLHDLGQRFGTPLFVYDGDRMKDRLDRLRMAFSPLDTLIAYSVKSNPNLQILELLVGKGAGADIVSGGELYRALRAGCPPKGIVFAGVGKTVAEMEMALDAGIRAFHVESEAELEALAETAKRVGAIAPVGVRANLDIISPTPHEYTRTGHLGAKFGVDLDTAAQLYARALAEPNLEPVGLDVHIGSQIRDIGPFIEALDGAIRLVDALEAEHGLRLDYIDLGGGYGVSDGVEPDLDVEMLGVQVQKRFEGRPQSLVLEPGRFITADAGCLLTEVLYVKRAAGKTFVITDAGMTELIRPSHYGGRHPIAPVVEREGATPEVVDVVGPVCESGDFLALDRELEVPEAGDLLWVGTAGAYGFTMASNYNSRPRPAEVLVEDGAARLVRRRETYGDLVRGELEL
ncbi:MAG: diaminopimelate decarboxylase [Longimicrobiales bacterium]